MTRWLIKHLVPAAAVFVCALVYLWLGYELHVPTFLYAFVTMIVADVIRKDLE